MSSGRSGAADGVTSGLDARRAGPRAEGQARVGQEGSLGSTPPGPVPGWVTVAPDSTALELWHHASPWADSLARHTAEMQAASQ